MPLFDCHGVLVRIGLWMNVGWFCPLNEYPCRPQVRFLLSARSLNVTVHSAFDSIAVAIAVTIAVAIEQS